MAVACFMLHWYFLSFSLFFYIWSMLLLVLFSQWLEKMFFKNQIKHIGIYKIKDHFNDFDSLLWKIRMLLIFSMVIFSMWGSVVSYRLRLSLLASFFCFLYFCFKNLLHLLFQHFLMKIVKHTANLKEFYTHVPHHLDSTISI